MVHKEKEIMKNKKGLLLLAVCLIVLLAVYFIAKGVSDRRAGNDETTPADSTITLTDIPADDIAGIKIVNSYGNLEFTRDDSGSWVVPDADEAILTQIMINNMAKYGGSITSEVQVEAKTENLETYKLDNPQYTVTLIQYDNSETVFHIGMKNQVTGEFYVCVDGVEGVYTVPSNFAGYYNFELKELLTYEDIYTVDKTAYLKEMAVEYGDEAWHIKRFDDSSIYDVSGVRAWFMVGLYENEVAIDTSKLEAIQTEFTGLELVGCEAYSASEEELEARGIGMSNPKGSIYYYYEEKIENSTDVNAGSVKVWLGNKTEDGLYYYARPDGRKGIYLMDAAAIDTILSNKAEDLLQKYISVVNINTIDSISVKMSGGAYTFKVRAEGEDDSKTYVHYHNDRRLDQAAASSFYTALVGVYAEKGIVRKEQPVGKPVLTITFNRNTAVLPVYEVAFYEYSVSYYKVAINGEISYLVNARDYNVLKETIIAYMDNIPYEE